ncbi:sulfatase-like hydrolase/transferase [Rhodopirellula halodulae]|uniref:sulfatase-like hydrolase/transferase n=1 Tax=Rhodopirellula halodulae TaxID=2894198 RepID=UPI001E29E7F6|nr:sulfatase-like hydrolase/transferase [Rhodopirellula sp. JC737]MCC9658247.1 sulfatase-like hydrolase/transferase [Rhodopirellula sp. JC737]
MLLHQLLARPNIRQPAITAFALLAFCCSQPSSSASESLPNLLVIVADDLGYGETGMMGNEEIPTPAIDALAKSGVRCTSGYVTSSFCSPSRAGFLSGRYQSRFGYDLNPTGPRNNHPNAGLPKSQPTFIQHLKTLQYQTSLVGKWHLGTRPEQRPTAKGFDRFFGFLHEGHYYVPGPPYHNVWTMLRDKQLNPGELVKSGMTILGNYARISEPEYDRDNPVLERDQPLQKWEYLTDEITQRAVDDIQAMADAPFALVVSFNAVHSPMQSRVEDHDAMAHISDPQRRIFAGMLIALDRGIGRLMKTLDQHELRRETLVVFFSDNGGPTEELTSSNAPLRGGKGSLFEGGIRVPMVWSMPGSIPENAVEDRPVSSLDIAATFLRLAASATQESFVSTPDQLDGVDVMPWLGRAVAAPERGLWWRMPRGARAFRSGDWKLVQPRGNQAAQLYHLGNDLSESTDLATSHPEKLAAILQQWQDVQDQMPPAKSFAP